MALSFVLQFSKAGFEVGDFRGLRVDAGEGGAEVVGVAELGAEGGDFEAQGVDGRACVGEVGRR